MPRSRVRYLVLVFWIFCPHLLFTAQAQNSLTSQVLEAFKPIERSLLPDEKHSYQIQVTAGQFLHLVIKPAGLDLVARLLDPNSATVVVVENLTQEEELLPLS